MTKAKPGEEASSPLPHEAATTADSRCVKHQAGASSGGSGHHRRTSGPLPRKVVGVHDPPARLPSEAAGETGPAMRHRSKPAEASNPLPFLGSGHKKAGFAMRRAPDHKDVQSPTTLAATASALDSRRGAPHQPRPNPVPYPIGSRQSGLAIRPAKANVITRAFQSLFAQQKGLNYLQKEM